MPSPQTAPHPEPGMSFYDHASDNAYGVVEAVDEEAGEVVLRWTPEHTTCWPIEEWRRRCGIYARCPC